MNKVREGERVHHKCECESLKKRSLEMLRMLQFFLIVYEFVGLPELPRHDAEKDEVDGAVQQRHHVHNISQLKRKEDAY